MYQVIEKRGEKENIIRKAMKSLSDCHKVIKMRLNYLHRFNNYDHTFYIMEEGRVSIFTSRQRSQASVRVPCRARLCKGQGRKTNGCSKAVL